LRPGMRRPSLIPGRTGPPSGPSGLQGSPILASATVLAFILNEEGRYDEAENLHRETLDVQRRVLGPEHRGTLESMRNLANDFAGEGRYSEAEKLQRETMNVDRRVLGPEHPLARLSTYNISCILARKGNRDEAFQLLREAVDHGLAPTFDLVVEKDPLLQALHGDPRFATLVADAKERAAASRMPK
jgi:tetratricopeptide (TPR) repeat protein